MRGLGVRAQNFLERGNFFFLFFLSFFPSFYSASTVCVDAILDGLGLLRHLTGPPPFQARKALWLPGIVDRRIMRSEGRDYGVSSSSTLL